MPIRNKEKRAKKKERSPDFFSALIRLSSLALSQTDPDQIISQALKDIRKIFNAKLCWLFLVEDNEIKFKSLGETKSRKNLIRSQLLPKLSPEILKRTYPIICNRIGELYKNNRFLYRFLYGRNIHKFMGVPLRKDRKLMGVLNVARDSDSPSFTKEDSKSLALLGTPIVMTKLKQAEGESRQSPDFLEAIIDNIPNPLFIKDKKHRWVILNQALSDLVGYPREKMLGKSDYDFFPKEQADFFWKKDEEMFRTGKVIDIPEDPITDKQGNIRYLHTKKAPLRNISGRITHLVGIIEDITERRRAEEELIRLSNAVRMSTDSIVISDLEGRIIDVNEATLKMYGTEDKEDLIGKDSIGLIAPEDRKKALEGMEEALKEGYSKSREYHVITKNGSRIPVEINSAVMKDQEGKSIGFVGITRDITERKQAEGSLKQKVLELNSFINNIPDMAWLKDAESRFIALNKAFSDVVGMKPESLIGQTCEACFGVEAGKKFREDDLKVMKSRKQISIEEKILDSKGNELWLETIKSPIFDHSGKIVGTVGVSRNVTERKRTEEALQISEQKFKDLTETTTDWVWEVDENGVYTYVSPKVKELLGYEVSEVLGKTPFDFMPEKEAERTAEFFKEKVVKKETFYGLENTNRHKDGHLVVLETNGIPIFDKEGMFRGYRGIDRNITERKRAEKTLIRNERIARERARLLIDLRNLNRIDDILTRVCQAVRDSGLFERAVMTLHDQVSQIVHLGQVGLPPEVVERARQAPPIDKNLRAQIANKKFRISDSFFVPAEAGVDFSKTSRHISQKRRKSVGGNWQRGDELFVPLHDFSGKIMGYLSVDTPTDGCRPDIKTIEALEMLVEAGAARVREVEAHKTLRRSEEYFRSLIENATDIVAIVNSDGVLRYQSPSLERVLGYKPEETIGKKAFEFIHPDDVPGVTRIFARVIQNPSVIQTAEYRARHKDGSWHNLEATGRSLLDNPAVRGIIINYRDITDRKQAEEALRESEGKYRELVNTSVDGVISVNPQMKIILWNPGAERIFGYTEKEVLGQGLMKIVPERYRKAKEKGFVEFRKTGSGPVLGKTLELEGLRKDGTEVPIELSVSSRRIGETYIATSIARDITDRKQAEEALRRSERKYRTLVETAQEGIGISDSEENLIFVNQAFADLLGYQKENLLGKNLKEISDEAQFSIFRRETEKRKKGEFSKYEAKLLTKRGKPKYVYISAAPLLDEDGSFVGTLGVLSDLTELKKAQEYNILLNTSRALSQTLKFDQVLKTGTQKMIEVLNADRCAVLLTEGAPSGSKITVQVFPQKTEALAPVFNLRFTKELFSYYKRSLQKQKYIQVFDARSNSVPELGRKILRKAKIASALIIPMFVGKKILGILHVGTAKKTKPFGTEEVRLVLTMANQVAIALENCRLMEDLKKEHSRITEQAKALKRQTREKDILLKVSRALSKTMDLDEVSKVASRVVGSAMGVERCAVTLATQDGNQLEIKDLFFKEPTKPSKLIGTQLSWDDIPTMSKAIKKGKPFTINNISDLPSESNTRKYLLKAGIKSVLGAGMFFGKKLIGLLSITSIKEYKTFTQDEMKLVQTTANQIAVAIENARLLQVVRKHSQDLRKLSSQLMKVQEKERKQIAQELHDEVGQMLQSMKMNLDRIKRNFNSKPKKLEGIEDWLLDTEKLLSETIEDIRTLTFDLRPSMLDDFGLIPTLRWYIENYSRRSNVKVSLKAKDKRYRFPPDIEITLYRIMQEALTNVSKHAQATEVSVLVSQKNSTAFLSVRDNGIGFDTSKVVSAPKGMGLLNVKERVDLLGGSFEIISHPRKGTTLNIKFPFSEVKHEEDQINGR